MDQAKIWPWTDHQFQNRSASLDLFHPDNIKQFSLGHFPMSPASYVAPPVSKRGALSKAGCLSSGYWPLQMKRHMIVPWLSRGRCKAWREGQKKEAMWAGYICEPVSALSTGFRKIHMEFAYLILLVVTLPSSIVPSTRTSLAVNSGWLSLWAPNAGKTWVPSLGVELRSHLLPAVAKTNSTIHFQE